MMNKYLILIGLLLLLIGFSFADSISSYSVPSAVNLGYDVTATGVYTGDINSGVLCSFYFYDAGTGVLVNRATDQYTTGTGRFTMPFFPINEPVFKRDSVYTLTSECGNTSVDANFTVSQRESISHLGTQEFDYLTTQENTDTLFIWGVLGLIIIFVLGVIYTIVKYAKG